MWRRAADEAERRKTVEWNKRACRVDRRRVVGLQFRLAAVRQALLRGHTYVAYTD